MLWHYGIDYEYDKFLHFLLPGWMHIQQLTLRQFQLCMSLPAKQKPYVYANGQRINWSLSAFSSVTDRLQLRVMFIFTRWLYLWADSLFSVDLNVFVWRCWGVHTLQSFSGKFSVIRWSSWRMMTTLISNSEGGSKRHVTSVLPYRTADRVLRLDGFTYPLWSWWSPAWGRWKAGERPCRWGWGVRGRHLLLLSGCSGSPWRLGRILRRSLHVERADLQLGCYDWTSFQGEWNSPQVSTRTSCSSMLLTGTSDFSTTTSPVRGWLSTQLVASKCPLIRNLGSKLLCRWIYFI